MPDPYDTYHDSFLENYLNTLEPRILNSDRLVVGKHKSGYSNILKIIFTFFYL
jgi:hypothetical protein